jgi:hypothetical protein
VGFCTGRIPFFAADSWADGIGFFGEFCAGFIGLSLRVLPPFPLVDLFIRRV